MNTKNNFKFGALAIVVAAMSGCATVGKKDFSCPAPDGFVCKSPSEIYQMTHGDTDAVYQNKKGGGADDGMFKSSKGDAKGDANLAAIQAGSQFSKPAYTPNSNPMPILEQPKVMRVWVAPWVDENQTLNYPSYKFKEITPRKWNFGGAQVFRNVLPTTAPDNSADFAAPNTQSQTVSRTPQGAPQGAQPQLPAGIQRQNDMVDQNALGTADFHNDQSPNGLPVEGSAQ